ncbi:MAG: hypothetical protein JHC57_01495 [Sphingopyxis sp.]|uniref:hypothetical protein n=1 Tax=Sphingopyxis sp. TaxID=1908224 RepID=UPI001A1A7C54|nr:hypothetical protein [Sphingopyxis sp.]MBJ7498408.1 hypothetical protein [Sphingopyxis sp.]
MPGWWFIAAAALLPGSTAADGDFRQETVAGWKLEAFDTEQDPENPSPPHIYRMSRATPRLRIEYEIKAGREREISVQRPACGTATDADGGVSYVDSVFPGGNQATDMAAISELVRTLDASFDDYCKAPPVRSDDALAGFSAAAGQLEAWAAGRPIPEHWAWHLDYLHEPPGRTIVRRNHVLSVRYDMPGDMAEAGLLTVDAIDCPGGEGFIEPFTETIDRSETAGNHYQRVGAALDRGVLTLASRCGLAPEAGREVGGGFREAITRGESEARKDAGGT